MAKGFFFAAIVAGCFAGIGCGTNPLMTDEGAATVQFAARLQSEKGMAKASGTKSTYWDSLIIVVEAADMPTQRHAFAIDRYSDLIVYEEFSAPAGEDRTFTAFTVDMYSDTIHGARSVTRSFSPNETVSLSMSLSPVCGSIYISLSGFDEAIDSVYARFTAPDTSWYIATAVTSRTSSARQFLTLDKIPYGTSGYLEVTGIGSSGDTVTTWSEAMVFEHEDVSLRASFVTSGSIGLDVQTVQPGVTFVEGYLNTEDSIDIEPDSSPVIISEIMYAANDSEYVELFNTTSEDLFFDSLLMEKSGSVRLLRGMSIPANGYTVIARSELPWADTSTSLLDFSSTSGNTVVVRTGDGKLLDRVAFCAGKNDLDWPYVTVKSSIVFSRITHDPRENNFGKYWEEATTPIDSQVSDQRGTPGSY